MASEPPKVFISYSHDSLEHAQHALELAERLRKDGIDAQLDQYVAGTPAEGWPRWMLDRLDWVDFVLVACTETYYRRFRGHEDPALACCHTFGSVPSQPDKARSSAYSWPPFSLQDSRDVALA